MHHLQDYCIVSLLSISIPPELCWVAKINPIKDAMIISESAIALKINEGKDIKNNIFDQMLHLQSIIQFQIKQIAWMVWWRKASKLEALVNRTIKSYFKGIIYIKLI